MRRIAALILMALAANALAGEAPAPVTFGYVDIYLDSGEAALAAYQVDFSAEHESARIVGVEGGDHAAFGAAPYFDPAATGGERVVIGAFSTAKDLPRGKTRVARIHLELTAGAVHHFNTELLTAATAGGEKIHPTLTLTPQGVNP